MTARELSGMEQSKARKPRLSVSLRATTCMLIGVLAASSFANAQPPRGGTERSRESGPAGDREERPRPAGPRGDRGGPAFGGSGTRPRPWGQWSEAERRQLEKFMEESFPRMFVELQRLKDRNEARYARRMTRVAPQMRGIMEALRTDPQLGALMIRERQVEMDIWQTLGRYRNAEDDATKRRVRAQLEELAGKAFDCRRERRELEVRQLEARVSVLRTRLTEAEKMRGELIERRVTELLERPPPRAIDEDRSDAEEGEAKPERNEE